MSNEAEARIRRALAALPDPPLPATLWPRLVRARTRQVAGRRLALGGGLAAVLALLALPAGWLDPAAMRAPQAPLAAIGADAPATVDAGTAARLRTLDRELQAAYRRGSGQAELAPLWEARAALVHGRPPATTTTRPIRI